MPACINLKLSSYNRDSKALLWYVSLYSMLHCIPLLLFFVKFITETTTLGCSPTTFSMPATRRKRSSHNATCTIPAYNPPLIYRARFLPEPLLTPPQSVLRLTFGQQNGPRQSPSPAPSSPLSSPPPSRPTTPSPEDREIFAPDDSIPKPEGEATRIKRNGYNLKAKLGWGTERYNEIQVRCVCSAALRGLIKVN